MYPPQPLETNVAAFVPEVLKAVRPMCWKRWYDCIFCAFRSFFEDEKESRITKSTTDPDCGLFVKGEHKRQFAYEAHTACDKNGFVLETVVTPGNVHDSVAFDEVYDKVTENFPQVEAVVADAAYKTPHICKKVFGDGRVLSTAYKRPQTMKNGHEWWKYVYDEFYNCVICPEYQPLKYSTTNRDGYREYKSDPNICAACPT